MGIELPLCFLIMNELSDVKSIMHSILKQNGSLSLRRFAKEYMQRTGAQIPFKKFGCRTPLQFILTLTDLLKFVDEKVSLVHDPGLDSVFSPSDLVATDIPGTPNSMTDDPDQKSVREGTNTNAQEDDDNPRWLRKYIPYEIDKNFERLARRHPDGIYEKEFLPMCEKLYQTKINPTELGFGTAFEMLLCCRSIDIERIDKRFVVYPKIIRQRALSPPLAHEPLPIPPLEQMSFFWKMYFEESECDPLFKYALPEVPNDWTAVEIIDACSPNCFWIRTRKNGVRVNDLMDKLNAYYREAGDLHDLPDFVCPGLPVVGFFKGEWHRAVISSITGNKLELFFVDYGTKVADVKRSQVKKLLRMFAKDEMIAVKAKMWNVRPLNDGVDWSMDSYTYIYHEWAYITLRMKIVKVDREVPQIEAILFSDKSSIYANCYTQSYPDRVFNLNELLVEEELGAWIVAPDTEELSRYRETARFLQNFEPLIEEVVEPNMSSINQIIDKPLGARVSEPTDMPFVQCEADLSKHIEEAFAQFSGSFSIDENLPGPKIFCEDMSMDLTVPEPQKIVTRTIETSPSSTETSCLLKPCLQKIIIEEQDSKLIERCIFWTREISCKVIGFRADETITKLLAVEHEGRFSVLKEKLFGVTRMAPDLAECRFKQYGLSSLEVHVNSCHHPDLWELFREYEGNKRQGVEDGKKEYILVPLRDAARICRVIDPLGRYDADFDMLLKHEEHC